MALTASARFRTLASLLFWVVLVLIASPAWGAVGFDTATSARTTSSTILFVDTAITVGSNSNRVLVILTGSDTTDTAVSSVAMTAGTCGTWTQFGTASNPAKESEIWFCVGPSTGSVTVRTTWAGANGCLGDCVAALHSYFNVDQTTPLANYASGTTGGSLAVTTPSEDMAAAMVLSNADPGSGSGCNTANDTHDLNNMVVNSSHCLSSGASVTFTWSSSNLINGVDIRQAVGVPSTGGAVGHTIFRSRMREWMWLIVTVPLAIATACIAVMRLPRLVMKLHDGLLIIWLCRPEFLRGKSDETARTPLVPRVLVMATVRARDSVYGPYGSGGGVETP